MWSHIPTCGQQLCTEGARGFPTNGQQILSTAAPHIATYGQHLLQDLLVILVPSSNNYTSSVSLCFQMRRALTSVADRNVPHMRPVNYSRAVTNIFSSESWCNVSFYEFHLVTVIETLCINIRNLYYEGHLESKERFAIKKYLLIVGKKKNMQVLSHTFTYFST